MRAAAALLQLLLLHLATTPSLRATHLPLPRDQTAGSSFKLAIALKRRGVLLLLMLLLLLVLLRCARLSR